MRTFEVPQDRWNPFCEQLAKLSPDAMVRIKNVRPDGVTDVVADNAPLLRFSIDEKSDACSNTLLIEAGEPGEAQVRHLVIEPIRIILKDDGNEGRYHTIEIPAENGTTLVTLHPGITSEALKNWNGAPR